MCRPAATARPKCFCRRASQAAVRPGRPLHSGVVAVLQIPVAAHREQRARLGLPRLGLRKRRGAGRSGHARARRRTRRGEQARRGQHRRLSRSHCASPECLAICMGRARRPSGCPTARARRAPCAASGPQAQPDARGSSPLDVPARVALIENRRPRCGEAVGRLPESPTRVPTPCPQGERTAVSSGVERRTPAPVQPSASGLPGLYVSVGDRRHRPRSDHESPALTGWATAPAAVERSRARVSGRPPRRSSAEVDC